MIISLFEEGTLITKLFMLQALRIINKWIIANWCQLTKKKNYDKWWKRQYSVHGIPVLPIFSNSILVLLMPYYLHMLYKLLLLLYFICLSPLAFFLHHLTLLWPHFYPQSNFLEPERRGSDCKVIIDFTAQEPTQGVVNTDNCNNWTNNNNPL